MNSVMSAVAPSQEVQTQEVEKRPELWQAVTARDARFDGTFYFAVTSTNVYCRPSCPSRRPKPENVLFFSETAAAERAGFRPCRRCHPKQALAGGAADVIDKVCQYMDGHLDGKVSLADLARVSGYSPFHLQRTFKRRLGITPRQYAESRRLARLKSGLRKGEDVTTAMYESGFSSSSRLYERANGALGMTPATYGRGGQGMRIRYATAECTLGRVLVAATERGVCAVRFGSSDHELIGSLQHEYPAAEIEVGGSDLKQWVQEVMAGISGRPSAQVPLDLHYTAFQRRVWEALRAIPAGATRSYAQIASGIGHPRAHRAVARACAANPVAVLIPCHRVTRTDGGLGGYRWGVRRKKSLLDNERALAPEPASGAGLEESTNLCSSSFTPPHGARTAAKPNGSSRSTTSRTGKSILRPRPALPKRSSRTPASAQFLSS